MAANDELILILDSNIELKLEYDQSSDMVLVDDVPYSQHYEKYTGNYEVTPVLYDDQELLTRNKLMTDNVTVHEIPVTWTTNPYGGNTVVIG